MIELPPGAILKIVEDALKFREDKERAVYNCKYFKRKLLLDGQLVLPGFEGIMLENRLAPWGIEVIQ